MVNLTCLDPVRSNVHNRAYAISGVLETPQQDPARLTVYRLGGTRVPIVAVLSTWSRTVSLSLCLQQHLSLA